MMRRRRRRVAPSSYPYAAAAAAHPLRFLLVLVLGGCCSSNNHHSKNTAAAQFFDTVGSCIISLGLADANQDQLLNVSEFADMMQDCWVPAAASVDQVFREIAATCEQYKESSSSSSSNSNSSDTTSDENCGEFLYRPTASRWKDYPSFNYTATICHELQMACPNDDDDIDQGYGMTPASNDTSTTPPTPANDDTAQTLNGSTVTASQVDDKNGSEISAGIAIGVSASVAVMSLVAATTLFWRRRKTSRRHFKSQSSPQQPSEGQSIVRGRLTLDSTLSEEDDDDDDDDNHLLAAAGPPPHHHHYPPRHYSIPVLRQLSVIAEESSSQALSSDMASSVVTSNSSSSTKQEDLGEVAAAVTTRSRDPQWGRPMVPPEPLVVVVYDLERGATSSKLEEEQSRL